MMIDTDTYITNKYLGMRLSKIRKSKRITVKDIAEASDLSLATIYHIEHGAKACTIYSFIKYANALGYDIDISKKSDTHEEETTQELSSDCNE